MTGQPTLPLALRTAYHRSMIYVVWGESLRKRGRRWEPKWLGDIDAESLDDARRIASERWPGIRLTVDEQRIEHHSTPKSGCRDS
jgi:hypothetical protein